MFLHAKQFIKRINILFLIQLLKKYVQYFEEFISIKNKNYWLRLMYIFLFHKLFFI